MFWQGEKGSTLIIVAIGLTVFFGFAALVVDAGMLYTTRLRLANLADAAALAGAQELPYHDELAEEVTLEYATLNGALPDEVAVEVDTVLNTVRVTVSRKTQLTFARFLGHEQVKVTASATAQSQAISSVKGVIPLAVENADFEFGRLYTLKTGAPPTIGSGEFGALSLGGNGASRYEKNLREGYQGVLKVGDVVDTETGNMSGPTFRAIKYRINQDPSSSINDFERGSPRLVIVPVYEPASVDSKNQIKRVKIMGFAAFFLQDETGVGNDSYVKGYFVESTTVGDSSPDQAYFGLNGVRLIR
ncbi:pilus assembly protein TadG-related protein [Zhaonella formicivorans]|uniref:pilus assembly protein TadG-related protein n=1 Tax=Zhaonella formicivorans TaxID=2528593 RepID=UPI0010EB3948|nr:pilus assembly protein TadG-related protein [Zhaonella formicivorans]